MTLSRPRTTRRVLRGSALGLGLLVAGGVTAPAAFAVVDPTATPTEVPVEGIEDPAPLQDTPQPAVDLADSMDSLEGNFGAGKDFTVHVAPQNDYPADLDLSGAVFAATPVAGGAATTCTTDEAGTCRFVVAEPAEDEAVAAVAQRVDATLLVGQYVLTQQSTTAGLSLATGSTLFTLCDRPGVSVPVGGALEDGDEPVLGICAPFGLAGVDVEVDSLFRTSLVTTVLDEDTEEPVVGVGFELTAPAYPRRTTVVTPSSPPSVLDLAGDQAAPVQYPEQISGSDGSLTFGGRGSWFLPGAGYTLTPTSTVPQGYATPSTYAFSIATTPTQSALRTPVAITRLLGAGLASGAPAPGTPDQGGVAAGSSAPAAAAATTGSGAAAAATTTQAGTAAAALATTGSPVGTMALLGGGLVALGGSALVAGSTLRRRARRSA